VARLAHVAAGLPFAVSMPPTRPTAPPPPALTDLVQGAGRGDREQLDALFPLVYDELRRLARARMRAEGAAHTLQPTALVHEAWFRLAAQHGAGWRDRAHFFAMAAEMMRRILVNHARDRRAAKRGGGATRVELDEAVSFFETRDVDLEALDEALQRLAALDPRASRVVELRFFAGLGIEEVAEALGVSPATVKRDWTTARAWLHRELAP
jgi:RNA polymerase sigma factor (TIGR02999 family)